MAREGQRCEVGAGGKPVAVKRAHEELLTASNEFTTRLYQNAQAQQPADAAGSPPPSDDEVADAEIVDEADDDQQSA